MLAAQIRAIRAKSAFTLIELLVVIAIIAILAAILFPVFAQAKSAAKKAVCISNMKQTALSTIIYLGDNDDTYPMGISVSNTGNVVHFVHDLTAPYRKSQDVLHCPMDPSGHGGLDYEGDYANNNYGDSLMHFVRTRCPSCVSGGTFRYNAYTPNLGVFGIMTQTQGGSFVQHTYRPLNESAVPFVASTIGYADGTMPRFFNRTETTGGWIEYWFKWEVFARHNGTIVFSFIDGHAKSSSYNGMPTGGPVQAGCSNYTDRANRPNYFDWTIKVPLGTLVSCGIQDYPKKQADFECVGHPGLSPNFGDMHGVPGTCIADVNDF